MIPLNAGGRIRSMFTLRELARRHDVQVLCSYRAASQDVDYEEKLNAEFLGARCVYNGAPWAWGGLPAAVRLLSRLPEAARQAMAPELASLVATELASGEFDVTVCDFLETAVNYPERLVTPSVLFEHNVEWELCRSQSDYARNWRQRMGLRVEARRVRAFEARAVGRFHHTVAVSKHDERLLRALGGHDRVTGVDTGVDTETYRPSPTPAGGRPMVVFTGHMEHLPNVDAVTWFCREIWPRVIDAVPAAQFFIVGRSPTASVAALASATVQVTGEVESVVGYLEQASVVVVPLRAGGGTRLKIYEAMAVGRPVVSTTLGAAGLEVDGGRDIVLADDAVSIATEVIALLTSPDRSASIGAEAARSAADHGWPEVAKQFERVLQAVVSEAGGKP